MQPVFRWAGLVLLCGYGAVILVKMMAGRIAFDRLFEGDIRDPQTLDGYSSYISAGRIQVSITTLWVAVYYLVQILQNPGTFPDVSDTTLAVLAVSHGLYLSGKAQAMLLGRLRMFGS
jgi:hypothetical protein